jgi:hypothetical protein
MDSQNDTRKIKSIHQLCIRRLSDDKYNFVFIYEMSDGGYSFQEYELDSGQARSYFLKHEWPLVLPEENGRTITAVRNGKFVGHYLAQARAKERSMPDE